VFPVSHPDPRERLIFALDVPSIGAAEQWVEALGDTIGFYKVGLELFTAGDGPGLVRALKAAGKRVFVDLKLFDVPATVGRAVARLAALEADFITVHGNQAMMVAAAAAKGASRVLAVTALTSLDEGDLHDLGFECWLRAPAVRWKPVWTGWLLRDARRRCCARNWVGTCLS